MVKGFSEMPKSRHDQEPSNNVDTDLKATSEDYLKSYKEDVDDSYIIPDLHPSHLTEKSTQEKEKGVCQKRTSF